MTENYLPLDTERRSGVGVHFNRPSTGEDDSYEFELGGVCMQDQYKKSCAALPDEQSDIARFSSNCVRPKPFESILFDEYVNVADLDRLEEPEFFKDLNLDQTVKVMTAGKEEYNLRPFFYCPLRSVDAINYRYEILRDLEGPGLLEHIRTFAASMREMRNLLNQADKLYYKLQKQSWFLDAVDLYCTAVQRLADNSMQAVVRSRGFCAFRQYLARCTGSDDFRALTGEAQKLKRDLSEIRYSLFIHGNRIVVTHYAPAADYGAEVLQTFKKFSQGSNKVYRFKFSASEEMNHVEAGILDLVVKLHLNLFSSLNEFCVRHAGYLDPAIARFDREVQFYVACLEHVQRFKGTGLPFCHPTVLDRSKEVAARDAFDLALADKLRREDSGVVTNDFYLKGLERIFVVSGPNQGGKTTFARTFGQLHYLSSIGCPVPARDAKIFLFDRIFTHFEKEEDIRNLNGKLEDELFRIDRILKHATSDSILIMNESFLDNA